MSIALVVNGTTYNFPTTGEDPNWAAELSGWAEEITNTVDSLFGVGDIVESDATIADGQAVATDVIGLKLQGATVKSAFIQYHIYRTSGVSGWTETGVLMLSYNDITTDWYMTQTFQGSSDTVLSITPTGQIQYMSDTKGGTYSGTMRFTAKVLNRV